MFLIRGIVFTYEAVRDWEAKLTPALAEELRRSRKGKVGRSWYIDETYIRVHGAFTICAGQPSRSVFWKLLEREAPRPKNATPSRLES